MTDKITTTGGVLIKGNDVLFDFSNTSVEFEVIENFELQFGIETTDQLEDIYAHPYALVRYYINDTYKDIELFGNSNELKQQCEKGNKIKIVKLSEAFTGIVKIINLLSCPIKSIPKENKIKVEFIGDSLTSGYGNNGGSEGIFDEDWTKTWCSHLCKHFNWEAMVHSYSCMGLVRDSGYERENQIAERRRRIIGNDASTKFDFSTFPASYVIINIGTNDFGHGLYQSLIDEFIDKMKELIEELYQQYGNNVTIILVHGPMMLEKGREIIKSIPLLYQNTSKKVFVTETTLSREDRNLWGMCYHPTESGHLEMANQLIPQFEKIVTK